MVAKTRTTLIAMPNADWRWEAALLHIWEVIQDETQWQGIPQLKLSCSDRNGYCGVILVPARGKDGRDAFAQHYLKLLRIHKFDKGCFMLTLNVRDKWNVIHQTRRWAFISKEEMLEER